MYFDRRRLLLGSARLAAWYGVFELCQQTSAWAQGSPEPLVRRWQKQHHRLHVGRPGQRPLFEGVTDLSVSFDVPVGDVSPARAYRQPAEVYNQIYLDPRVPPRPDGRIEAPIIKFRESVRRFA